MARCGRCGRGGVLLFGIRGGLCGHCRQHHGPWIRRTVAEFYETLARAEGHGPTAVRLGQCRTALDLLEKLEEYEARGIPTTREPTDQLRDRLASCRTRLEQREHRRSEARAGEDSEG